MGLQITEEAGGASEVIFRCGLQDEQIVDGLAVMATIFELVLQV